MPAPASSRRYSCWVSTHTHTHTYVGTVKTEHCQRFFVGTKSKYLNDPDIEIQISIKFKFGLSNNPDLRIWFLTPLILNLLKNKSVLFYSPWKFKTTNLLPSFIKYTKLNGRFVSDNPDTKIRIIRTWKIRFIQSFQTRICPFLLFLSIYIYIYRQHWIV